MRPNICENERKVNSSPNALELGPCRRSGEHSLLSRFTTDLDDGKFLLQLLYLPFLIIKYFQIISRRIAPAALQNKKADFAAFTVDKFRTAAACPDVFQRFPTVTGRTIVEPSFCFTLAEPTTVSGRMSGGRHFRT